MKIFRLDCDVTNFQSFASGDEGMLKRLPGGCRPVPSPWVPPVVYVYDLLLKAADFSRFWFALVASPRAMRVVGEIIQPCCELLPLPVEDGRMFTVANVLACVDCLDHARSKVTTNVLKNNYVFLPDRVTDAPIFRTPEDTVVETFVVERTGDPKTEFKAAVEQHGLTGLIFWQVWEG